jgi:hypothetical protein
MSVLSLPPQATSVAAAAVMSMPVRVERKE